MKILILVLLSAPLTLPQILAGQKQAEASSARSSQAAKAQNPTEASFNEKLRQIAVSGRVQLIGDTSAARLEPAASIAPGAPPLLAFRYFDGQARHRFGDLDLVMDDAGH